MSPIKKPIRRRKKRRHYKTGIHHSPKCSKSFKYRSGWELSVATYLDLSDNVISYEYETLEIPYLLKEDKHIYIPDFLVYYKDKPQPMIIEIKRQDKLGDRKVMAKTKAAREWAEKNNYSYQIWTDQMIAAIRSVLPLKKSKIVKAKIL
jgi:hypothetical protein